MSLPRPARNARLGDGEVVLAGLPAAGPSGGWPALVAPPLVAPPVPAHPAALVGAMTASPGGTSANAAAG